jgi:hypothetical protein
MADGDLTLPAGASCKALHSFTADDYHRMAEVGILPGGDTPLTYSQPFDG